MRPCGFLAEYEQQGADRAVYGDNLLERLAERLMPAGVSRSEARELRRYRQFYLSYPRIRETLSPELAARLLPANAHSEGRESPTAASSMAPHLASPIHPSVGDPAEREVS